MLTKTTLTAIRALIHIGGRSGGEPLSIRHIAEYLGESPTYLAKVARHLVMAGILRAHRGVMGGIELNRPPESITLRAIVEACQGAILADFCQETPTLNGTCAFHVAAAELHDAIVDVLSRWTLDEFVARPEPCGRACGSVPCVLYPRPAGSADRSGARSPRTRSAARGGSKRARSRRTER